MRSRLSHLFARRRETGPGPSDLPAPEAVDIQPRHVRLGGHLVRTLQVTGYPREVFPGWLEPLLAYPGRLDVSLHLEPIPPELAASRLRRQIARLESDRAFAAQGRRVADPRVDVAADDAQDLADRLARGEGKLFRAAIYLAVHAEDAEELEDRCAQVRSVAASLLLDTHPTTFRSMQGWTATLPFAVDTIGAHRTMDTAAAAAGFPFTSPDRAHTSGGVLYGRNPNSAGIVTHDRWALDNYGSVTLARSGSGKSYLTKLEVLRSLYDGVQVAVIDPENEYERLADSAGGAYLRLGAPGVRINPLDLHAGNDPLTGQALFLHTFIAVLCGEPLSPGQRAALDRAIIACYAAAGINSDPRTWMRPAPLLRDLAAALRADAHEDPEAAGVELAERLAPHVSGTHAGLWDGPTTTRPDGHLVVWCLRDLPDELRPAGTLVALDAVWRRVTDPTRVCRDLVVVDEAWILMREPEGAKWLYRLAKSARKYWTGLAVVTQDADDLLGSELGQAVVANTATQILLTQAPQAIDAVGEAFHLSRGEREFLLSADRGHGLLAAGADRVAFAAVASEAEHALITTDPAEQAHIASPGEADRRGETR